MAELSNAKIALALDELGDLYELDGAIVHRVVAYRNAAKVVRECSASVAEMARAGRATELPGIGNTLQEKITTLLDTGDIPSAEKLRAKFPAGLVEVMRVPGLGPKRARQLFEELGIASLDALREAAVGERIRALRGFGSKAEENVLASLEAGAPEKAGERYRLDQALEAAEPIVAVLREHPAAVVVEVAGSARRMTDTVKDIDIVAAATDRAALSDALHELPSLESVANPGEAGAKAVTHTGLKIELRVVEPSQFGNLLQHLTGSKAHNMALRDRAVRRGLHVSEYGVLDDNTGKTHECAGEGEVYALLGLDYVEPELREDRGELEAAENGSLPELVALEDLKGDLHCHTVASDGKETIEGMVEAARAVGYRYLAITDHSASHGFGNDVQPDELLRQVKRVHKIDAGLKGFKLLAGTETSILTDGRPDYEDKVLAELDWVIASVHSSFRISEKAMTERMVAAIEHPLVDAIGHPTGRMLGRRGPYAIDMERVIEACAANGTMLEINANPNRRDLPDVHARAAAQAGVPILINCDAHRRLGFAVARYGIATARRAWLTKKHIANARTWAQFQKLRKPGRG